MEYKDLARAGLDVLLPEIEVFSNQFIDYEIVVHIDEFTSICPKTNQPDFGRLTITYIPDKWCIELKSLKFYLVSFRQVPVFHEQVPALILGVLTKLLEPVWMEVEGRFTTRGGLDTTVRAVYGERSGR